ncbi:MAG: RNA methyltransferase [Candidatus Delongbacteria bacterium]|nr:RNA methyltransferase [Candidatus Delongbacteria bacterium]MBN2835339.1 RNA methyltransferase [Candidatus Delongbacteria bacterium]
MKTIFNKELTILKSLKQKKFRNIHGLFIVEGIKPVFDMLNNHSEVFPEMIVLDENKIKIFENETKIKSLDEIVYTTKQFDKLTDMENSEGILSVYKIPKFVETVNSNHKKVLLLDEISDPGNMGTLIRTAAWFGIDLIVLFGNCTDIYSPKCVRSSMGQIFQVDFIKIDDAFVVSSLFESYHKIGTFLDLPVGNNKNKKIHKLLLMIGNEAHGLNQNFKEVIDENFLIEGSGKTESLNATIAASICMYKFFSSR